jgi:hypothetical protein
MRLQRSRRFTGRQLPLEFLWRTQSESTLSVHLSEAGCACAACARTCDRSAGAFIVFATEPDGRIDPQPPSQWYIARKWHISIRSRLGLGRKSFHVEALARRYRQLLRTLRWADGDSVA